MGFIQVGLHKISMDTKINTYLLPLKAEIDKNESIGIDENQGVKIGYGIIH